MMIDLADCDRLFPSIHEHHPGADDAAVLDTSSKPYLVNHWMLSLTIILGKVIKLLYSASESTMLLDWYIRCFVWLSQI